MGNQILLQFELDKEQYGLVLNTLSQIILLENILKLPKCPDCIYGVGNHKGTIITIVNIPLILKKSMPEKQYVALLSEKYSHIGLIISEKLKTDIISQIDLNQLKLCSENVINTSIIEGELLIGNRLIQFISPNKLYNYLMESVNSCLRKEFVLF